MSILRRVGLIVLMLGFMTLVYLVSPWHRPQPQAGAPQDRAIAQVHLQQTQIADLQKNLDTRVQAMMFKYDCTTPETWKEDHPRAYPQSMVLKRDHTWSLSLHAWTMAVPSHQWVLLLCAVPAPAR